MPDHESAGGSAHGIKRYHRYRCGGDRRDHRDRSGGAVRARTKLQRAQRRLDVLVRCLHDYHPWQLSQATIAAVLGVSQPAVCKSLRRTGADDPEAARAAALLGWIKLRNQPRL